MVRLALALLVLIVLVTPGMAAGATKPDATQLRLSDAVFEPATVSTSAPLDVARTSDVKFWPRIHHSADYARWGVTAGYVEEALWTPSGAGDGVTFDYLGSVFRTQPGAYDAWQDGATYWPSIFTNVQSMSCLPISEAICNRWELAGNNGINEWDDSIQMGQCLLETRAYARASVFAAQESRIAATLLTIGQAAITAARSACQIPAPAPTPPASVFTFGIDALRVETHKNPDWTLSRPAVTTVRIGERLFLSVYYTVNHAPAGASVTFHVTVRRDGRVVLDTRSRPRAVTAATIHYRHAVPFTARLAGSYTVSVGVKVGGMSESGTASFTTMRSRVSSQ